MVEHATQWSQVKRLGVTFLGLFLCLNIIPLLLVSIPVIAEPIGGAWIALWAALMPTLCAVLGIDGPISTMPNGSSDMTWNYVQELCYVAVAAVAAVAWVACQRRQSVYETMDAWMQIIVRYGLAMGMISYGLIKVFTMQFEALGPLHLARTYGESSPAGLLWSFMGYSPVYAGFTGLLEVIAGALLLSRRTTTLGALVAVGVMANVVMMNFCYDVPVKLFSSLLLLMALFLAGHDARRLIDVFVRNRAAAPIDIGVPVLGRRLRIARLVAKGGFLLTIAWMAVELSFARAGRQAPPANPQPLYGAWNVERFTLDDEIQPPAVRWRQFTVPAYPVAQVRRTSGDPIVFALSHDTAAGTITLTSLDKRETMAPLVLAVARPETDTLVLTGPIGPNSAEIHLRRIDTEHAPLMTRGFHWIQEAPYNR